MGKITAIILTKNEETNVADCLERLKWCDYMIVMDSLSTDSTVEIARQLGAQVIQRSFLNYADQRNAAIEIVKSDWIFFVDADERVSGELAEEVKLAIQEPEYDGWWIPTRNNYFGKWLGYGGFYPDFHLRVGRKGNYRFDPSQKVHERPLLVGNYGYLKNPIIHYSYQNLKGLKEAKARYASTLAEMHFEKGLKPTYHLLAAPIVTFFHQLVALKGYKDGRVGWLISIVWGYYAFLEYWKVWGIWWSKQKKLQKEL